MAFASFDAVIETTIAARLMNEQNDFWLNAVHREWVNIYVSFLRLHLSNYEFCFSAIKCKLLSRYTSKYVAIRRILLLPCNFPLFKWYLICPQICWIESMWLESRLNGEKNHRMMGEKLQLNELNFKSLASKWTQINIQNPFNHKSQWRIEKNWEKKHYVIGCVYFD